MRRVRSTHCVRTLLVVVTTSGCSRAVGFDDAGATPSDAARSASIDPTSVSGACSRAVAGTTRATNEADLSMRLTGTWVQCGADSVFGTAIPDASGFVFAADHTWAPLVRRADGTIDQSEARGTWRTVDILDDQEHVQLNLALPTGGEIIPHPAFGTSSVSMDNNGVFRGTYARF